MELNRKLARLQSLFQPVGGTCRGCAMRFWLAVIGSLALLTCSAGSSFCATTYHYDDLGRLKSASYDNGKEVDYNYDPAGNRSSVVVGATPHGAPSKAPARASKAKAKH